MKTAPEFQRPHPDPISQLVEDEPLSS